MSLLPATVRSKARRRPARTMLVVASMAVLFAGLTSCGPPPVPTVIGVSPTSGPTVGGTTVTITGTQFNNATVVQFGANVATFTVNDPTTITTTSPPGTGTVDVTVSSGGGTSTTSAVDQFTYSDAPPPVPTVTGVSPTSGRPRAGRPSPSPAPISIPRPRSTSVRTRRRSR